MTITLLQGDCRDVLSTLDAGSVQCVITSPPFFGLRRYSVEGAQIGMEDSPASYVAALVDVFRLVKRVLREDGTCWVNLGDSYGRGERVNWTGDSERGAKDRTAWANGGYPQSAAVLPEKNLLGIPWMVAFALRDDGWYLRSAITWCKGNPMPESVRDRPTSATEMIFLLAKQPRYFYDADAIREPHQDKNVVDGVYQGNGGVSRSDYQPGTQGFNTGGGGVVMKDRQYNPAGRNKRNWWVVNSQPYSGAHFATWPEKLVEPMVLAGSSPRACERCGAPWERIIEGAAYEPPVVAAGVRNVDISRGDKTRKLDGKSAAWIEAQASRKTTGWRPTCACPNNTGAARCVVLDPFCGSGTTLKVAERYGRDSIGIDLGYLDIASARTDGVQIDMESLL